MRHRKHTSKLNRTSEHRLAMMRNLAIALVHHERIHTTKVKADQLRPFWRRSSPWPRTAGCTRGGWRSAASATRTRCTSCSPISPRASPRGPAATCASSRTRCGRATAPRWPTSSSSTPSRGHGRRRDQEEDAQAAPARAAQGNGQSAAVKGRGLSSPRATRVGKLAPLLSVLAGSSGVRPASTRKKWRELCRLASPRLDTPRPFTAALWPFPLRRWEALLERLALGRFTAGASAGLSTNSMMAIRAPWPIPNVVLDDAQVAAGPGGHQRGDGGRRRVHGACR